MKKIDNKEINRRAGEIIKNILNYFINHPGGIKKEEYYRKMRAKHDYCWYRNHEL